ncbi:uncharacterized protein LOC110854424 [Folsomia candida]|nr:uncharacterized protein LOC110854424 [Folsomia candida]
MKILSSIVILLTGSLLAQCSDNTINLRPAVDEIVALIDVQSIQDSMRDVNVIACINKHDPKIIPYLRGEDFKTIHNFLWNHPQFLEIIQFLADGGYPEIYDAFNNLYEFLGLPFRVDKAGPVPNDDYPVLTPPLNPPELCENLQEIVEAVRLAFPEEELVETFFHLFKTDTSVKALIAFVRQPEKKEFAKEFAELPEVQKLIEYGKSKNMPVNEIMYFIKK